MGMKGAFCLLILALPCVVAAQSDADLREQKTQGILYMACMQAAALKIDDGLSDASVIARALKSACQREWETFYASIVRHIELPPSIESQATLERHAREELAIRAVLKSRQIK